MLDSGQAGMTVYNAMMISFVSIDHYVFCCMFGAHRNSTFSGSSRPLTVRYGVFCYGALEVCFSLYPMISLPL